MSAREDKRDRMNEASLAVSKPFSCLFTGMVGFKRHLSCGGRQATQTQQVVGHTDQMSVQLDTSDAAHAHAAQAAVGFHPAEDFFDPLALSLADPVAGMPGGAPIQPGGLAVLDLRDMRTDALAAQERHKSLGVIALVGTQRARSQPLAGLAIEQVCSGGRFALQCRTHADVQTQSVAVLPMSAWPAKHSLASLPLPLRADIASGSVVKPCVSLVRVLPRKSTPPRPSLGGGGPSLGLKLLAPAHASISVPSTVRCSEESKSCSRAIFTFASKNRCARSSLTSRSRRREKLD